MTTLKLLLPFIALTLSCNNNRRNHGITKADTFLIDTNRQISKISTQDKNDGNYIENVRNIEENPYSANYDTTIKGGFSILYSYDREMQYLLYKKGSKVIDTIGDCSLGLPYKNLGYVGADFDKTFVFVNSFGSGNSHYIWLYEKETAKNLIPEFSAWIDVDTLKQVLLYSKADVPNEKDSMTLFDTRKMTQKEYAFPEEIFDEPEKLNRIRFINIADKTFTIEYDYKDRTITKTRKYSR